MDENKILTAEDAEALRHKAEDTLQNYELLVNAVPGGIAQYELRDGKVITRFFSDGICALTGYTRAEREAMWSVDALPLTYEEDVPLLAKALQEARTGRENLSITYRIRTKGGALRWVHLSAAYREGRCGEQLYQAVFTDVDKEKQTEQALRENQLRYEAVIKSSGINIWEYSIPEDSLRVISGSSRALQDHFIIQNYIQTTVARGYVREDCISAFLSIFARLRAGEKEITEDIWYKTSDEAGWWCERVTYTNVFDSAGRPVKAFGAGRDVTREKEAEARFHEEMAYRKALQSDNLCTLLLDLTANRVVEVNAGFASVQALAGVTADDYFSRTAEQVRGAGYRQRFVERFNRQTLINRFGGGEYSLAMELTRVYDTEKIYWISYNVHMFQNPDTGAIAAHIACVDITQEKVMQTIMETVAKSDYDFFLMVDGSRDSAHDYGRSSGRPTFDEAGSFEAQHEAMIRRCVCPEEVPRVIAESKIANVWAHVKDGQPYNFSFSIRCPDGTMRRKQMRAIAVSMARKTYLMSRIDVNDIYEEQEDGKRKLRAALQTAEQASRVKSDFLNRMSHDIRTPMNAVLSLATLGQSAQTLPDAKEDFKKISASGEYLLSIINNVLDLSRMESKRIAFHPTVIYLPGFIRETMAIVAPSAAEKNVRLAMLSQGITNRYLRLDPTYVRQVAINLLSNAIKFTPPGGRVELKLENRSRTDKLVENRMTVTDSGVGISPEFLPKVFSPFEQENAEDDLGRQGTGLGLTIVKNIVDLMGGSIRVESEKGKGTTFTVDWTFETADIAPAPAAPAAVPLDALAGKRVLLAEDHPLNAEIAAKLLARQQMAVTHVPNGKLALARFMASPPGTYAAILMDIRMPVMNGLDAAKAIRALPRPDAAAIPILAMTANAFEEDRRASLAAGMNAHLSKPIDPQKLYATLARFLQQDEATTERG